MAEKGGRMRVDIEAVISVLLLFLFGIALLVGTVTCTRYTECIKNTKLIEKCGKP